jgi:GT2 family glycosyltransferase
VHRDLVQYLGGLFDPAYKGFYADPDFSMRAHETGIPIQIVDGAILRHANNMAAHGHQENLSAYYEDDQKLFRSRWDRLGAFRDPS